MIKTSLCKEKGGGSGLRIHALPPPTSIMARVDTTDLLSISEANKRGISGLVHDAEQGHEHVLLRNNRPVAAVVSMQRLTELQQLEEDLLDVALVTARMLTTEPARHSLEDVLARFGYTRDELRDET